jgi:hypothetical protein
MLMPKQLVTFPSGVSHLAAAQIMKLLLLAMAMSSTSGQVSELPEESDNAWMTDYWRIMPLVLGLVFGTVGVVMLVRNKQAQHVRLKSLQASDTHHFSYHLARALGLVFEDNKQTSDFSSLAVRIQDALFKLCHINLGALSTEQTTNLIKALAQAIKDTPYRFHFQRSCFGNKICITQWHIGQFEALLLPLKDTLMNLFHIYPLNPAIKQPASLAIDQFVSQQPNWNMHEFKLYTQNFFPTIPVESITQLYTTLQNKPAWCVRVALVYTQRFAQSKIDFQTVMDRSRQALLRETFDAEQSPTYLHEIAHVALTVLKQTSLVAHQVLCICTLASCNLQSPHMPALLRRLQRSYYRLSPTSSDYQLGDVLYRLQWLGVLSNDIHGKPVIQPELMQVITSQLSSDTALKKSIAPYAEFIIHHKSYSRPPKVVKDIDTPQGSTNPKPCLL